MTTHPDLMRLRRGDGIFVSFGSKGARQYAKLHHFTSGGAPFVVKWRAASQRWTQPVRLFDSEFLCRALVATADDREAPEVKPIPPEIWHGHMTRGMTHHPLVR
jgi:hypothetical protein